MWTQLSPVEYCARTLQGGDSRGRGEGRRTIQGGLGEGRGEEDNWGRVGGRGGGRRTIRGGLEEGEGESYLEVMWVKIL